jgi:sterol 3beta-glucosyltransferase
VFVQADVEALLKEVNDASDIIGHDATTHFYHARLALFRRLFALPDEELVDSHSCSLVRPKLLNVPITGILYIARRHLCFRSNTGCVVVVPLADVTSATRGRVSFVVREALRVETTTGAVFHFVGFAHLGDTLAQVQFAVRRVQGDTPALASARSALAVSHIEDDVSGVCAAEATLTATLAHAVAPMADGRPLAPLRIVILTIGSRGDVQPVLALGAALKADGHEVTIGTHLAFKDFVEKAGLTHATLAGDPEALMALCVGNGMFTPAFIIEALSSFRGFVDELLLTAYQVVVRAKADVLVQAPTCFAGAHIAEALEIPLVNWFTMPCTPTTSFAHPFAVSTLSGCDSVYNFVSFLAVQHALWQPLAGQLNSFRTEVLALPVESHRRSNDQRRRANYLLLLEACGANAARLADVERAHHGLLVRRRQPWRVVFDPPKPLSDFLAAGRKQIYVGFGSITGIPHAEVSLVVGGRGL